MSQDIVIAGAAYSAVPAIQVPKSAGGTAAFLDTSDATATAAGIASGLTAYAAGTKLTGTAPRVATGVFTGAGGSSVDVPCPFQPDFVMWSRAPTDATGTTPGNSFQMSYYNFLSGYGLLAYYSNSAKLTALRPTDTYIPVYSGGVLSLNTYSYEHYISGLAYRWIAAKL